MSSTPSDAPDDGGLALASPAFDDGGSIPTEHTCDGADVSPELQIRAETTPERYALFVDDPDAPVEESFVHWVLWNVRGEVRAIPGGIATEPAPDALDGARQGQNGFGNVGYAGPCPPEDDGPHTYRFRLFALDGALDLEPGATGDDLLAAIDGVTVEGATLTGTYER